MIVNESEKEMDIPLGKINSINDDDRGRVYVAEEEVRDLLNELDDEAFELRKRVRRFNRLADKLLKYLAQIAGFDGKMAEKFKEEFKKILVEIHIAQSDIRNDEDFIQNDENIEKCYNKNEKIL